jgi:DNA-binding transcriptional ArsR family regulator
LSEKSKTVADSIEETKERHRRYLRAINNPIRRKIIHSLVNGNDSLNLISQATGIDEKTLDWHIKILIDGFCIEKTVEESHEKFILTQEALVINYLDK